MVSIGVILLIAGMCFYFGTLYINPVMLNIGYTLLLLLAVSVLEIVYRMFTLECYINAPLSMTEDGYQLSVVVKVRNKGVLPTGKIEIEIKDKNVFQKRTNLHWITIGDVPAGEKKYSFKMQIEGTGCHEIVASKMKIYSLFGLVHLKRSYKDFTSVLVMPKIYPIGVQVTEAVRNFLGDADVYDAFRPGHDSGEIFEVRSYREKDKLQSIHWKLSAKMDELMVKEGSLPKACAVVLFMEFQPWKQSIWTKKKIDPSGYMDFAASLSYGLMEQNCPHFVAWYSAKKEGIRRIRVDNEESFYQFLNVFLREITPIEKDIREEYRKEYKRDWYLNDIMINEKLELYKNGELLIKLDEKKIEDECGKMELLL